MRHTLRVRVLRPSTRAWVPYAVLIISVMLTAAGAFLVVRTGRIRDELRFQTAAEETRNLLEIRIHTYMELLRAGSALFGASDEVTGAEFSAFVTHLRIAERYPGIQGIGFALRVTRDDLSDPGRRLDRLALADLRVWPPGDRTEYTSIVYLEPQDSRNRRALGFDMLTDSVRRDAMERARDSGEPAASGKVTLIQDGFEEPAPVGFLIYVPVYGNGRPTRTLAERRTALSGYVYSPFRVGDLLGGILGSDHGPLAFEVFDGPQASPETVLYRYRSRPFGSPSDALAATHTLDVAGRAWTIKFTGADHFDGSTPIWLAPATLSAGLVLSFALFATTLWQYRRRETAEQHTAQLRASEEAMRESDARLRRLVVLERDARAEAQQADRAKDEFLATLSHELRTPLNAILGWITMMRTGRVREERKAAALEVIERNARAQARLIEDLLDVSRIITGKVRLDLQPLNAGPIAQTVVEALRPGAEAKGVQLHAQIDPAAGHIMADAARLQQVLWNLFSNAIKFTPRGGHIYFEVTGHSGELELRVRDTGVGIAPDFLPHVFERFRQADSTTTRAHSGVGLGLAIVRHLVELHGGHISAHSQGPGLGSEFVVRLPLADRQGAARDAGGEREQVHLDGIRVLVVDDHVDTREMLDEALTVSGAKVIGAQSADRALSYLREQSVDVLVSDIGMPDVDGYALIRRVRELPGPAGRIPAIALTAYARPEDRDRIIEAGYQIHLAKPIDLDALHAALNRLRPAPASST